MHVPLQRDSTTRPSIPSSFTGLRGSGKTHLVTAIGLEVKQHHPDKRVLFVSAATFRTQYTDAVRTNKVNDFVHFYQTIDVLIIDDSRRSKRKKHSMFSSTSSTISSR